MAEGDEHLLYWGFPGVSMLKNLSTNAGDVRNAGPIPELRGFLGGVHGNLLQCFCLENPMDRGAWRTTVLEVIKSRTQPGNKAQWHTFCDE